MIENKIVSTDDAVSMLATWRYKGANPLHHIRIFGTERGLIGGVSNYVNSDQILIPEYMDRHYDSYSELFADLGELFDVLGD